MPALEGKQWSGELHVESPLPHRMRNMEPLLQLVRILFRRRFGSVIQASFGGQHGPPAIAMAGNLTSAEGA